MTLKGRNVLVTGADGFIGSRLVELLIAEDAHIVALSQYNSFNFWGWLEDIPVLEQIRVVTGDVRDAHFCQTLVRGIDVIFHLAALIPIPYSYQAPGSYVDTNIRGTLNICQAAREAGTQKIVHTSTSEVYGTARYIPIDEAHPLTPQSPYSATKIGADAIAQSFYHSFALPVVTARPFNSYGPRQSARAVIPSIISQIASGFKEVSLGALTTTRDFTYVDDTCRGFLTLAQLDGCEGEVFNIGSQEEISIEKLFNKIAGLMESDARAVCDDKRMRPTGSEVLRLCCNHQKLFAASGFRPEISLRDGLSRTIAWFQDSKNLSKYKGHIYNV